MIRLKYISILGLLLITLKSFSQSHMPVIKAISRKAKIYEQSVAVSNWSIDPKIKLDVHSTGKLARPVPIMFKTDIDSIRFNLAPGHFKDFIVVLNGKDSCLTRITSPEPKDLSRLPVAIHDTIPFFLNAYNTNYVPIILNGIDSLLLNFDSGATEVCIISESLQKKVKSQLQLYSKMYKVQIGKRTYESNLFDISVAGHEVDGLLGWNLFDGMIVELDYDHHRMVVHSKMPEQITRDAGYQKFKLTYIKNKPFIESEISQDGVRSKSLFFFDLGYQRAVMLDNDALTVSKFPVDKMPVIKKVIMHGTRGNELPVITADLQSLKIGKFILKHVPTQIMTQGKPMPGANVHYLGSDVLKRFNTVFDFQRNMIYLKPNSLYNTPYADQKERKS